MRSNSKLLQQPASLLGVSNSEMVLSEKNLNFMDFDLFVSHTLEFPHECEVEADDKKREAPPQTEEKEEKENKRRRFLFSSSLTIKVPPPLKEFHQLEDDEEEDGFKTPPRCSSDHKVPEIPKCPPAPRKPRPPLPAKRKCSSRRMLLDLSAEVESLFPPALRADLAGKIKKVRQGNDATQ